MKTNEQPPKYLYYGTIRSELQEIYNNGLYDINLYYDKDTALHSIKKKGKDKIIIRVNTLDMHNDEYKFYLSKNIWSTEYVPNNYIKLCE